MAIDIQETIDIVHNNMKSKGFWDNERNVGETLMLVVTELSEALEAHRINKTGYEQKDTFEDEIADTLIRIFDMCGGYNIDIERQLKWKIEHNKTREHKHGKNY